MYNVPRKYFRSLLLLTEQANVSNENGQSGHIFTFEPSIIIKPIAFFINHDAAHHVLIRDIQCSNLCLITSVGDLPGELFCEKRRTKLIQPQLDWQTVIPGGRVRVMITPKCKNTTIQVIPFMFVEAIMP